MKPRYAAFTCITKLYNNINEWISGSLDELTSEVVLYMTSSSTTNIAEYFFGYNVQPIRKLGHFY